VPERGPLALARRTARRLAGRVDAAPLAVRPPAALLELRRHGPSPLTPGDPGSSPLRVAVVVPSFRRGSGGHSTVVNLVAGLEARGHECSLWLEDFEGRHAAERPAETARAFREFFGELDAAFHVDFAAWTGADVALATSWHTVPRVLRLSDCAARAYLVQDHEPEFHPTSAESTWARQTYGLGLHCIAASAWLAGRLRELYGARADHFDLGVDGSMYRPRDVPRRDDRLVFYARAVTPRRAVPLGVLALAELHRRRPEIEIAFFGEPQPVLAPFPHSDLGILEPEQLALAYSEATVGMVLSMTNPSRVAQEMLACGLPCVELASESVLATFGTGGPLELAAFDPLALADAAERLLDDRQLRERRSQEGIDLVASRTWPRAAEQVEAGLRHALAAAQGARGAQRD
jgi:glycosyltransferase involved in cell wall biosynthesis